MFDLDGTLYDKRGLAGRVVHRLWWCLPLLAAERLARRDAHYVQFASEEEFFGAFFATMARGHWWSAGIAAQWYNHVYMPTMMRLIRKYHHPRPEVMALVDECVARTADGDLLRLRFRQEKLEALGIDPKQFDLLISAPELGALKPSEPCARRVMEMLQADPEDDALCRRPGRERRSVRKKRRSTVFELKIEN